MTWRRGFLLLLVPAALLASVPDASAAIAPDWSGTTTQGQPIHFVIGKRHGQLVIREMDFGIDLVCQRSGEQISAGVGFEGFDIPIVNRRFDTELVDIESFLGWHGTFESATLADGTVTFQLPAFTPIKQLQLCSPGVKVGWRATPTGSTAPSVRAPIQIRITNDGSGTPRISVTAGA